MANRIEKPTHHQYLNAALIALLKFLRDGDEADRCYAAQALGKIKDRSAVTSLIEKLQDEDLDVCIDAATALGDIGCASAVPALLNSLHHDPDGEMLMIVVESLGKLKGDDATAALLDIAKECPAHIEELEDDWDYYWDIQLKAVQALGNLRVEEATPILLDLLQDDEMQDIESEILAALSKIKISGEKALLQLAQSTSSRTRRRAINALSNSTSEISLETIAAALKDPSNDVREQALISLGKRKALKYFSLILKLMVDPKENVRARAMEIALQFSTIAGKSLILFDIIKTMIRDRHEKARITALEIFYNLLKEEENVEIILKKDDEEAVFDDELITSIKDSIRAENADEAMAALRLLTLSEDESCEEILCQALLKDNVDPRINREAALLLGDAGNSTPAIIDALQQSITHENQAVRLAALTALDKLPDVVADEENEHYSPRQIMLDLVNPAPEEEKSAEVEAEQETEDADTEEELAEEFSGSEAPPAPEEASSPASTIASIEQDNELVAKKLSESTHFGATKIEDSLEELPEEIQEFGEIVKDNMANFKPLAKRRHIDVQLDIRLLSINLLAGKIEEEEIFETISQALDDTNEEVKRAAISALGHKDRGTVSDEILDKIIAQLDHDNAEIRIEAVRTLGKLGNRDNIPAFMAASTDRDSEVRIQALRALANHIDSGNTEVIAHISSYLKDDEYGVRRIAIEILTSLEQRQELGRIIDTGYADGGALAADAAQAAKKFGEDIASPILLRKLEEVPSSAERRFVIEMIQKLYQAA